MLKNVQENFTRLDSISGWWWARRDGSGIPDYITQTFLGVTVDGVDPATAIAQGHWSGQAITSNCGGVIGPRSELERDSAAAALVPALEERDHPCARLAELRSGLAAVEVEGATASAGRRPAPRRRRHRRLAHCPPLPLPASKRHSAAKEECRGYGAAAPASCARSTGSSWPRR